LLKSENEQFYQTQSATKTNLIIKGVWLRLIQQESYTDAKQKTKEFPKNNDDVHEDLINRKSVVIV